MNIKSLQVLTPCCPLLSLYKSLLVTAEQGCSRSNVFDLYSLSTGLSDLAVLIGSRKTEHQVIQH